MRPFIAFLAAFSTLSVLSSSVSAQRIAVYDLTSEYKNDPVGIDVTHPRFGWKLRATTRGVAQSAYQIRVAQSERDVERGRNLVWDTKKVASDRSVHVAYDGEALVSGGRYFWQVRVWDQDDRRSAWSDPAIFEMGLLTAADWQVHWITADVEEDVSSPQPAHMLRGTFEVDGRVASARAYVTSLGLYEFYLNGERVGDEVLTPGWTSYDHQLQYQTYNVTDLISEGENAMGVMLGDGWYRGYIGFRGQRNFYGEKLGLLAQVVITYRDGSTEVVGTSPDWKATNDGPVLMSDIYNGETYDARKEIPGWSTPGLDDNSWSGVSALTHPKDILVAPAGPPVRKIEEITPVEILRTPEGDLVFDMGQNIVGWVRLEVEGPAGTTVTLRHAEVLDSDGNFYTANLRAAKQEVRYTLKGGGPEVYEPHFTFQGFRYVAVDGYPGVPTADDLTGMVIHSDMERTGRFTSSNELVNQLQHNIVWGQKGNFVDVPTDCPQRDERLGWTGDAQVFVRTAAFNYDVASFFTKWLADLFYDQYDSGSIPHVIPNVLATDGRSSAGATGWADAGVIIPWTMYEVYADERLLGRQYPSMKAWIGSMKEQAGDDYLWIGGRHFGDWLAFATTRSDYPGATTSKDLLATAYFSHSSELVAQAADVLGLPDEAQEYRMLSERIKEAFREEFVTENGRVGENTQTAYAVALALDILPEEMRGEAARRLAEDVRAFGHLTTGFLGTPHLCHVLTEYGYDDVAYELLLRTDYPSWLYPVTQGATTIWERWDGRKPDGSFQNPGMNSFNHYAYGAIGDWMYRVMAGLDLDPSQPGYKHIRIHPLPGGGFTHAEAALETMYGPASSSWTIENGTITLSVTVPPNTSASVRLPNADLGEVREGDTMLSEAEGVSNASQTESAVLLAVGSGRYVFNYPWTE